jgi:hypothetical protein
MQLGKWIKVMGFLTVMALCYLHMQMKIYALAYQAKVKEHEIQKLRDDNGVMTYHILALKSANHIGQKLLTQESDMQFVSNDRVYEVASNHANVLRSAATKNGKNTIGNLSWNLQNFLTLSTAQAEAQPLDRR